MPISDDELTVEEAAKESGYHPEHITRLVREKKIRARKLSVIWLVDRKSLYDYQKKTKAKGKKRGRKPEN